MHRDSMCPRQRAIRRIRAIALLAAATAASLALGCSRHTTERTPSHSTADSVANGLRRALVPSGWSASITHPFFPLGPGTVYVYASRAGGRSDVDTMTVTREQKRILGIPAVVVHDRTYRGGVLAGDTADWYAQDTDGNVWYLGEEAMEYQNGKVVSTAGSWEAGKNGAEPGIMMRARPRVGDKYRQEYRRRVAEDMARVLSLSEAVSVPFGTFTQCLETEEWSPLEPGAREHKYYARGVGMVLQRTVAGGSEEMVLVKVVRH